MAWGQQVILMASGAPAQSLVQKWCWGGANKRRLNQQNMVCSFYWPAGLAGVQRIGLWALGGVASALQDLYVGIVALPAHLGIWMHE